MSLYGFSKLKSRKAVLPLSVMAASCFGVIEPTYAQSASLEEVVVTARKRTESLQDIPASIAVFTSDVLRDSQISDVTDLKVIEPTLNVGEVIGLLKINMRGLGNTSVLRGEDSEVAFHVDGAVVSRLEIQSLAFFDLDRVEVLRGPQGTLYGRNSTAGAINLITNKPTRDFEGSLNLKAGNYSLIEVEAAAGGPLTETLAWRGAVTSTTRDGYGENINTKEDINDENRYAARLHLLWNINDDMDLLLSGEYADQDDNSGRFGYLGLQFPDDQDNPLLAAPGVGAFPDPDSHNASGDYTNQMKRETWSTTATFDWRVDENWTIKNLFNYRDMNYMNAHDLDQSAVVSVPAMGIVFSGDGDHFSNEFQLGYEGEVFDNHLSALFGLFYFEEDLHADAQIGYYPGGPSRVGLPGDSNTESAAAYWNIDYELSELITLRAGGRYTDETREIDNALELPDFGIVIDTLPSDDKKTSDEYTGEYGIDFNFAENQKLYLTYAEGFRAGAGLLNNTDSPIVEPTTVESWEIGFKGQYFDDRLSLSVSAYDSDVENLQRTQVLASEDNPQGFVFLFRNAAGMSVSGVEFDTTLLLGDSARIRAAFSYVDAEFDEFITLDPLDPASVIGPFEPQDVAGNNPRLIPEWSGVLQGEYDFNLASGAVITTRATASYIDEQSFDEFNREPFTADSYTLFDASVTYVPSDGAWQVTLWGKNLTDEDELADAVVSGAPRTLHRMRIPPMTYGATLSVDF